MKQAFAVPATSPLHIALNERVDAVIVEKDATHIHLADPIFVRFISDLENGKGNLFNFALFKSE